MCGQEEICGVVFGGNIEQKYRSTRPAFLNSNDGIVPKWLDCMRQALPLSQSVPARCDRLFESIAVGDSGRPGSFGVVVHQSRLDPTMRGLSSVQCPASRPLWRSN